MNANNAHDAKWVRIGCDRLALVVRVNLEILWAWREEQAFYVGTKERHVSGRTYTAALARLARKPGCAWVANVPAPEGLE